MWSPSSRPEMIVAPTGDKLEIGKHFKTAETSRQKLRLKGSWQINDNNFVFDSLARSRRYSVVIGPWESAKARFNSAHGVPMGVYVWQWGSCVPLEPPMERDPAGDRRAIEFQAPQWTELSAMWAVVPGQSRTKSQMVCEELHSSGKRQVRDLVQPDAWLDSAPASTLALDPTVLGTSGTVLLSFLVCPALLGSRITDPWARFATEDWDGGPMT